MSDDFEQDGWPDLENEYGSPERGWRGGYHDEGELLPMLDLEALAKTRAKAITFAIERIAPLGEVTLFTGPGSAGKSLLAQQLCTVSAAAIGSFGNVGNCLGLTALAGPALYVTCEDSEKQLHYRQERLCEALGVDMAALAGKLHIASLRGRLDNELEGKDDDGNYAPSKAYHLLADTIRATGARIVALDNVAHLFAGNENDRHDVTRFVNLLNRLAGKTGAAILLIGHPNKSGDSYSGSTAWLNAVRSQVWIDRVRDNDGNENDRDARVLSVGKANYGPTGDAVEFRWHNWAFVRPDDLPADTRAELAEIIKANSENEMFLRCLAKATDEGVNVSHASSAGNYAPKVFAKMPTGKGTTKSGFEAAMHRLLHLGQIRASENVFQYPNRTWAKGIKATLGSAQKVAQNPAQNVKIECTKADTKSPEINGSNCTRAHETGALDTTYLSGAGPDGPPPPDDASGSRNYQSFSSDYDLDIDPFDPRTWEADP